MGVTSFEPLILMKRVILLLVMSSASATYAEAFVKLSTGRSLVSFGCLLGLHELCDPPRLLSEKLTGEPIPSPLGSPGPAPVPSPRTLAPAPNPSPRTPTPAPALAPVPVSPPPQSLPCRFPFDCLSNSPFSRCCSGRCVDTSSDNNNCFLCGLRCLGGLTCCNSLCVDLQKDRSNCGFCGNQCLKASPLFPWITIFGQCKNGKCV